MYACTCVCRETPGITINHQGIVVSCVDMQTCRRSLAILHGTIRFPSGR